MFNYYEDFSDFQKIFESFQFREEFRLTRVESQAVEPIFIAQLRTRVHRPIYRPLTNWLRKIRDSSARFFAFSLSLQGSRFPLERATGSIVKRAASLMSQLFNWPAYTTLLSPAVSLSFFSKKSTNGFVLVPLLKLFRCISSFQLRWCVSEEIEIPRCAQPCR